VILENSITILMGAYDKQLHSKRFKSIMLELSNC